MENITQLVLSALAVLVSSYLIPSVTIDGFFSALVVAIVLGILNTFLKPILVILTLPITVVTLGFFALVINTLMIMLADKIVPGFHVPGFWSAFIFGIVLFLVNTGIHILAR